MTPSDLARVLRAAAEVCEVIAAEATAQRVDWIDQRASPLGPRRHCTAVKARIAAGTTDAAVVGRRHLLSQAALGAELGRSARKSPRAKLSVADELRAELRLVGGRS